MICYMINEQLTRCHLEEVKNGHNPYVIILTRSEWMDSSESFDMGIELEPDVQEIMMTKADVNYDSITGTFRIPDRNDFESPGRSFAFALDEKGIVFIDDGIAATEIVEKIAVAKRWRKPSYERFMYDFLDCIISSDQALLKRYEDVLDHMEESIQLETGTVTVEELNEIRSAIRELRNHYEQMLDLTEVLEENENHFFSEDNLRYFRLFAGKIERLKDMCISLRDHTIQVRDVYKTHLDIKQNNIMTVLTVVTTIFMPLTVIVGWYGMNFRYMPELEYQGSYFIVILISAAIVLGEIMFFKKKKWL